MDEYKPITGELRGAGELAVPKIEIDGTVLFHKVNFDYKQFIDLCDGIDAVHAQLEHDYQTACEVNERQDADYARVKAERDSMAAALDAAQGEHAYAPESHYMMLPKDADGKPIHVGDVMEWPTTGETFRVVGIGDVVLFYVEDGEERAEWTGASTKRHHVPDTWERIIMDAVCGGDEDELVARCKALAGEK